MHCRPLNLVEGVILSPNFQIAHLDYIPKLINWFTWGPNHRLPILNSVSSWIHTWHVGSICQIHLPPSSAFHSHGRARRWHDVPCSARPAGSMAGLALDAGKARRAAAMPTMAVEGRGRREVDLVCGPNMSSVQSAWHAICLKRVTVIWISREPINKFGDSDVIFESLGPGWHVPLSLGAAVLPKLKF